MLVEKVSFDQEWESIHNIQEWGAYPPEHVIRFFARNYYNKNRSEIKVLDFGCGAGACTWYLAREGFDVYAFDGSESAIKRVMERLGREKLHADTRVLDAIHADYTNASFDAVLDNACIYANKLENIKTMYGEIYRMLKAGGKVLSVCFSKNTQGYGKGDELETDTFRNITEGALVGRGTAHFFEKEEFSSILIENGFKNVVVDTMLYTDRGITVEQLIGYAEKLEG